MISVTCMDPASPAKSSHSKAAPKKRTDVKNASIVLSSSLSVLDFSRQLLAAHELDEVYAVGPVAVPPFKIHWTGIK